MTFVSHCTCPRLDPLPPSDVVRNQKKKLEDLFSSVLSQCKKYHPPGNLRFNYLGIFEGLKLLISMQNILSFSLKLNITPYTLGCYGLTGWGLAVLGLGFISWGTRLRKAGFRYGVYHQIGKWCGCCLLFGRLLCINSGLSAVQFPADRPSWMHANPGASGWSFLPDGEQDHGGAALLPVHAIPARTTASRYLCAAHPTRPASFHFVRDFKYPRFQSPPASPRLRKDLSPTNCAFQKWPTRPVEPILTA